MWRLFSSGWIFLWFAMAAGSAEAETAATAPAAPKPAPQPIVLRVAALTKPPYAYMSPTGPTGLSIIIFNDIAAQNNWKPTYTFYSSQNAVFTAVISHQADVGLGGLSLTADRDLIVDYSDAAVLASLGLAVKKDQSPLSTLFRLGGMLLNWDILALILLAMILVLACGALIRLIEREHAKTTFPNEYRENAWWAAQTLVAHNCGNKLPHSERGRHIALFLMLGGTIFTAQLTALMTNNLSSVVAESAPISEIGDVGRHRVATISDSYAQQWLQQNLLNTKTYGSARACVEAVKNGEAAAAVCDEAVLRRALADDPSLGLKLAGSSFGPHQYAFILKNRSPYLEGVNRGIGVLFESGRMSQIYAQWLGSSSDGGSY